MEWVQGAQWLGRWVGNTGGYDPNPHATIRVSSIALLVVEDNIQSYSRHNLLLGSRLVNIVQLRPIIAMK